MDSPERKFKLLFVLDERGRVPACTVFHELAHLAAWNDEHGRRFARAVLAKGGGK